MFSLIFKHSLSILPLTSSGLKRIWNALILFEDRDLGYPILVKFLKNPNNTKKKSIDPNIQHLQNSISEKIGLNVIIKNNKRNKGTITFSYKEIDQLNKIIEIIKSNY